MARKTPPKDQPVEQPEKPTMPSIAEQLGTDDPQKQAELIAVYKQFANTRPIVVTVYYDPRVDVMDIRPIGGDMSALTIQEVLILAQQKILRDIQEQTKTSPPS